MAASTARLDLTKFTANGNRDVATATAATESDTEIIERDGPEPVRLASRAPKVEGEEPAPKQGFNIEITYGEDGRVHFPSSMLMLEPFLHDELGRQAYESQGVTYYYLGYVRIWIGAKNPETGDFHRFAFLIEELFSTRDDDGNIVQVIMQTPQQINPHERHPDLYRSGDSWATAGLTPVQRARVAKTMEEVVLPKPENFSRDPINWKRPTKSYQSRRYITFGEVDRSGNATVSVSPEG